MILFEPKVEIIEQLPEFEGVAKMIERVGRTCWASENLITDNSWEKFVKGIMERRHNSPLEHGTIYLKLDITGPGGHNKNDTLAYIYANDEQKGQEAAKNLLNIYKISEQNVAKIKDILEIIE